MRPPMTSGTAAAFCALVSLAASAPAATLFTSTVGRVTTVGAAATVTTAGTSLGVGDSSNNTQVFASIFNFTINASAAEIAAASQITFTISATGQTGTGPDVRLVALNADDNAISAADASAAGQIVGTYSAATIAAGLPNFLLTFDVTSIVKADALAGNFSSFRLDSALTANDGDGGGDVFVFGTIGNQDAQLNIIPEPTAFTLLAGAMALSCLRRRR